MISYSHTPILLLAIITIATTLHSPHTDHHVSSYLNQNQQYKQHQMQTHMQSSPAYLKYNNSLSNILSSITIVPPHLAPSANNQILNITAQDCQTLSSKEKTNLNTLASSVQTKLNQLQSSLNTSSTNPNTNNLLTNIKNEQTYVNVFTQLPYLPCTNDITFVTTSYQTNINSDRWILGNLSLADLQQNYAQRSANSQYVTNCPIATPFFTSAGCVDCLSPNNIFNIQTATCGNCPNNTSYDLNTRSCQPIISNSPTVYQTNLLSDRWLLGNLTLRQITKQYVDRSLNNPNVTNCPISSPFWNGNACSDCLAPNNLFDLSTKSCSSCPIGTNLNLNTRDCESIFNNNNQPSGNNPSKVGVIVIPNTSNTTNSTNINVPLINPSTSNNTNTPSTNTNTNTPSINPSTYPITTNSTVNSSTINSQLNTINTTIPNTTNQSTLNPSTPNASTTNTSNVKITSVLPPTQTVNSTNNNSTNITNITLNTTNNPTPINTTTSNNNTQNNYNPSSTTTYNTTNSTNATAPSNATNHTNPTAPSNTTNHTNPTEPYNATNATAPSNTTNHTNPTEPSNATNHTNPTEPSNATNHTNPTAPSNATNATAPSNATNATAIKVSSLNNLTNATNSTNSTTPNSSLPNNTTNISNSTNPSNSTTLSPSNYSNTTSPSNPINSTSSSNTTLLNTTKPSNLTNTTTVSNSTIPSNNSNTTQTINNQTLTNTSLTPNSTNPSVFNKLIINNGKPPQNISSNVYCPPQLPFYNGSACIICNAPSYLFDVSLNICSSCPDQSIYNQTIYQCVPLNNNYLIPKNASNLINDGMPTAYWNRIYDNLLAQNKSRKQCPSATPYYNGISCINCTNDKPYFNLDTRLCQSCNGTFVYDSVQRDCIDTSPSGFSVSPSTLGMSGSLFAHQVLLNDMLSIQRHQLQQNAS